MNIIKKIFYIPSWLMYRLFGDEGINEELYIWSKVLGIDYGSEFKNFLFYFGLPEYRSVFYWRLGWKAFLLKKIAPPTEYYTFQRQN